MTGEFSRRAVLRGTAAGSLAAFGAATAAGRRPTVHLIEAGVRYDVPDGVDYDRFHLDDRTGYAVDVGAGELVRKRSAAARSAPADGDRLLDGRRATGDRGQIVGSGETVPFLPTTLSARKRVRSAIHLDGTRDLPTIAVRWDADAPTATVAVDGRERVDLEPGATRTVALDAATVDVRTTVITDDRADVEGVPDWQVGRRRETGTASVEAVPVIELHHHGELAVVEDSFA